MLDAAAAAYVALTLDGTDTLLMAADHALRRELSRRIRDDLIRLGIVQPGPRRPRRRRRRGQPRRPDRLHPQRPRGRGRRARPDPGQRRPAAHRGRHRRRAASSAGHWTPTRETGQRRWTDRHFLYANYEEAELGYAVTDHTAQGRTVHTGLAVITGTEDRQHAYVALTRGTDTNTAYVFTLSPKLADPAPGPRPAPELARYDKHTTAQAAGPDPAAEPAGTRDALGVLADVLQRDGQQLSASQTWQQALADADHLAILHAIWTDQTAPAREQHYKDLLLAALPPGYRQEPGHQAKWLWRTLRAAELAGLDLGQVLADAIAERDLDRVPATCPASSTPASATAPAPSSRGRQARGPRSSPTSPTPNAVPTPPRSPR